MPTLFVPEIGTVLTLAEDWEFTLYAEHRNNAVWNAFDLNSQPHVILERTKRNDVEKEFNLITRSYNRTPAVQARVNFLYDQMNHDGANPIPAPVKFPKGTVLQLDRIYVRKGKGDFSSLSFLIVSSPDSRLGPVPGTKGFTKGKKRFWAKLDDCNKIEFT